MHENPNDLIRLPTVIERTGRSRSALYAAITNGEFSRPIKLGARCSAWPAYEVEQLNAAAIREATPEELRELVNQLHERRKTFGLGANAETEVTA